MVILREVTQKSNSNNYISDYISESTSGKIPYFWPIDLASSWPDKDPDVYYLALLKGVSQYK